MVPGRMICDENYKYICYGGPEELFDLKKDGLEKINIRRMLLMHPYWINIVKNWNGRLALTHFPPVSSFPIIRMLGIRS